MPQEPATPTPGKDEQGTQVDPTDTDHPTGQDQAGENVRNEPAG